MKPQTKRKQRQTSRDRRSARSNGNKFVRPRTIEESFAMPERDRNLWNIIGQVVSEVRSGSSLTQASRKFSIDRHTVQRLGASALRKLKNGRWAATKYDHLLRVMHLPYHKGLREVGVRDSREASLIGQFWSAVERYQTTGDSSALRALPRKHSIDANGKRVRLLTNLRELDRLGSAGVLSFETIYGRTA